MPKLATTSGAELPGITRIFAYGFDAAGFDTRADPIKRADKYQIQFVPFNDPISLELAEGVIIPQGIFETFEKIESLYWIFGAKIHVRVHRSSLLERERQIFNLLRQGKWVCFLVGEIIDDVHQGTHLESARDTDLCKRVLNAFEVKRRRPYKLTRPPVFKARDMEFQRYVDFCGAPSTVFELPHTHPVERRVIVELDGQAVGLEFDAQLFFLPFSPRKRDWRTAKSAVETVVQAVTEYRGNRIIEIPAWVDDLRFTNEEALYLEINSLLEKVNRLESQQQSWRDYKAILTTSGGPLKNRIIAILESFFEFKVDPLQEDREDAVIIGDNGTPLAVIEAKSTEKGFEISFIDQLSSHRDNHGLPDSAGILFINNDLTLADIHQRLKAEVPESQVKRAKGLNILMVRTIDLLFLMRSLEDDPHRKKRLIQLFCSGGGWLKADMEGYRVVS